MSRKFCYISLTPLLAILTIIVPSHSLFGLEMTGRMGIGMSNQLVLDTPALSFKVQDTPHSAIGGLFAVDSNQENTDLGLGIKFYRLLFDEPNLNFYLAGLGAYLKQDGRSGYQLEATFGSEIHWPGLESIGLSFECGLSLNKVGNERHLATAGHQFFSAGIHFYL